MRLVHPESAQVIDVSEARAQMYAANGWRLVSPDAPDPEASLTAWRKYARSQGFALADLEGKSRDDLRAALI